MKKYIYLLLAVVFAAVTGFCCIYALEEDSYLYTIGMFVCAFIAVGFANKWITYDNVARNETLL